jgi:hypothetical protein
VPILAKFYEISQSGDFTEGEFGIDMIKLTSMSRKNTIALDLPIPAFGAVRAFLSRLPSDCGWSMPFRTVRARGEERPDSDADLALILAEGEGDWQLVTSLAELSYDVFLDCGCTYCEYFDRYSRP